MSLVASDRRLSSPTLEGLGGSGSRGLGYQRSSRRLCYSLRLSTSPLFDTYQSPQLLSELHQGESSSTRTYCSSEQRCGGISTSNTRLLQSYVRGYESIRSLETDYRSLDSQQIHRLPVLQDGDPTIGSSSSPSERLDGLIRPSRCLPPDSHQSGIEEVPEVRVSSGNLPIQSSVLRLNDRSSSFYSGHGSGFVYNASPGLPSTKISGRLVDPGLVLGGDYCGKGHTSSSMSSLRHKDKCCEESSCPFADSDLSRNEDSIPSFEGFPDVGTYSKGSPASGGVSFRSSSTSHSLAEPSGEDVIPFSPCARSSPKNESSSVMPSSSLGLSGRGQDGVFRDQMTLCLVLLRLSP